MFVVMFMLFKDCLKVFVYTFLSLTAQKTFAAASCGLPPSYDFCVPQEPPPNYYLCVLGALKLFCANEHDVIVRFKSCEGELFEVCWDVYGLMYNGGSSVEAVLERNLLAGDHRGGFSLPFGELSLLIKDDLMVCLKKGIYVHYNLDRAYPLGPEQLKAMHPSSAFNRWEVLAAGEGCQNDIAPGEFRVLFARGGYRCQLMRYAANPECGLGVQRQMLCEDCPDFVGRVKFAAREALSRLQRFAYEQGESVVVRCVRGNGQVRSALWSVCGVSDLWSVCGVSDRRGRSVCDFLHDCAMQGTSVGYTDEDSLRYFSFSNKDIRKMLQRNLLKDMKRGWPVEFFREEGPLQIQDVRSMPYMTWTLVPQGSLKRCDVPHTWSLTFSGVTLAGVPAHDQRFFPQCFVFYGYLFPRNFLWALDYEALLGKKRAKGNVSWYEACVRSERMNWCI